MLLERFAQAVETLLGGIVDSVVGSEGFAPIRDETLPDEVGRLARQHVATFVQAERQMRPVKLEELDFLRERAAQRARELVPLADAVNAHLMATRASIEVIARVAGADPILQAEGFQLVARLADYTALAVPVLVETYIETVEGERADREADRRLLLEELLTRGGVGDGMLVRRARSLGLESGRSQVVVCVRTTGVDASDQQASVGRWAGERLAGASGRSASRAFVVVRSDGVVAVLDSAGPSAAQVVLADLAVSAQARNGASILAGIGTPFVELNGFHASYEEAQRALRHSTALRPILCSPDDISLFDELLISSGESCEPLIPPRARQALQDPSVRITLQTFLASDMNVASAATALSLHPNSLRYRLRSIASTTGRDPSRAADLFELCAAARIIDSQQTN